jgi:methionine-rich copper-binding protein CopC
LNPPDDLLDNKCYRIQLSECLILNPLASIFPGCPYGIQEFSSLVIQGNEWTFTTGGGSCNEAPPWYNNNWMHRQKFTVQHSKVNGDLLDFPVYLRLSDFGDSFFSVVKEDGSDIVITSSDMITKLPRELEFIDTSGKKGALWFKASNLYNTSNTDFYMYYGYSAAAETDDTATWPANYQNVSHLHETPTISDLDTEFQDSTSKNNDVKSIGAMDSSDRITGQIGWGVDLDGTNDYLDFGNIASISGANNFTLSAWLKPTSTSGPLPIFAKGTKSVISLMHNGSEWKGSSNSNGLDTMYHTQNLARNTNWIYSVMVFDANQTGNNRFKIYVNGEVLNSMTYSTIRDKSGGSIASLFAGRQNSLNYQFYGDLDLDELRVSNSSHTAPWIKTEYLNQFSPSTFYSIGGRENGGVGDTVNPRITSLSPADNATNVEIDTNLIISFSEAVDTQTGNLIIKKSSDDSEVQTLSITSATGNGTSILTFNPNDLSPSTNYYVLIDSGSIKDLSGNSFSGISNSTTWNFLTQQTPGWMDSDWSKRVKFTILKTHNNGLYADFPVYLRLSDFTAPGLFSSARSDGGDIRITQGDGMSVLASELVFFDAGSQTGELYFKAPFIHTYKDTSFFIYFDNPNARAINPSDPLGRHDVWTNNYVAVYHLQENPNSDITNSIFNSTKNSYYGTPSGAMTSADKVTGKLGSAIDFDGVNDFINTADINEIDNAQMLTYSMWFKRRNPSSRLFIGKGTPGDLNQLSDIRIENDGKVYLEWKNGLMNTDVTFTSNDTNWHHLVSSFNGAAATNNLRYPVLFDGVAPTLDFPWGSSPTLAPGNSAKFLIGKRNYDNSVSDGFIDEVRISKFTFNAKRYRTEYNNQNSPSTFYSVLESNESVTSNNQPKISNLYPANRATQVPRTANLIISFNENISANTGNIVIKKLSDGSTVQSIPIESTSISANVITINPSSDLEPNTEYYVLLDSSLVSGACGLVNCKFPGIQSNMGWRFTTTGPQIKETIFHDTGF